MNINDYIQELIHWNKTHNLVAKNEIHNLQEHIDDSLSLGKFIVDYSYDTIIDIGSGGGFPSIPLGFWIKENNISKKIIATDIVSKKLSFLKWCSIKFELDITVEDLNNKFIFPEQGLIVSRAFSSIKNIIAWRNKHAPLCNDFLLLKGDSVHKELEEAKIDKFTLFENPRGYIVQFIINDNANLLPINT